MPHKIKGRWSAPQRTRVGDFHFTY